MSDFQRRLNLASERLGAHVLYATDDFFAEKDNLLKPAAPVWKEEAYTDRGKWMDGWESRRKRTPGHDWCIVRLGLPGKLLGVDINTAFFTGNYPEGASIEGCFAPMDATVEELTAEDVEWVQLLDKVQLQGNHQNLFEISSAYRVSHLRFHIYPDGGVARLRVYGEPVAEAQGLQKKQDAFDVLNAENGGIALAASDEFYSSPSNLTMPHRPVNMGDGWETKRRRGPGYDWSVLQLGVQAEVSEIEVDTTHFRGNYPDRCQIEAIYAPGASKETLLKSEDWKQLLPESKLQAHTRHRFTEQLQEVGPVTHVRLNIYPDGGVARLRVIGRPSAEGLQQTSLAWLNALLPQEKLAALKTCGGSAQWAEKVAEKGSFDSFEALVETSDKVWAQAAKEVCLEAFATHPRIGAKATDGHQNQQGEKWSKGEQKGIEGAEDTVKEALLKGNEAYYERFGYTYIVCATGKSAAEMLSILEGRLTHTPEEELLVAREQQRQITNLRLAKLLGV